MGNRIVVSILSLVVIGVIVVVVVVAVGRSNSGKSADSSKATPQATVADLKCPVTPGGDDVTTLQSSDQVVGTGAVATASSTVSVKYTGCLSNGKVFDASSLHGSAPVSFPLSGVIVGWQQGIPGMKVGGTRTLVIPGSLAYGANPPQGSGIPANATLTFQIELVAVQ